MVVQKVFILLKKLLKGHREVFVTEQNSATEQTYLTYDVTHDFESQILLIQLF